MSRGNSLSDELDLRSVLGDTRVICIDYVPFWGSYSEPKGNRVRETEHRARANDNLCKYLMYHAACKVEFQPFTW